MVSPTITPSVCSACGEVLTSPDFCVPCLLRTGLDIVEGTAPENGDGVIAGFEIARRQDGSRWELGRGAMGITYRASDPLLRRAVALKVISPRLPAEYSRMVRERFLREARAAAALRHPNVASVFQFGEVPQTDSCFCAMELVEGETLEARVRREGPLELGLALEIAIQITRALMAAAERGLVHRDLKPGNIMLTPDKSAARVEVKVIDFGLAKIAADVSEEMELTHGGFVGTPAFASPEQFEGDRVDSRSDIFALGVTLWFALTGRLPFAGKTIGEIRQRQIQNELPVEQLETKSIPDGVINVVRSCLALDPAGRPASPGELMRILESCRNRCAKRRWRQFAPFILGFAILMAGGSAFLRPKPNDVVSTHADPGRAIEKGIAVLPFENLSAGKDDAFFADGIRDDILTSVGKIKGLKVISRASVRDYRETRVAGRVREIGRALGVSHVLDGSVRRAANRAVVNVALIDTRDERQVWSERYERTLTDTLSLQGELAIEIARALHATLTPAEVTLAAVKPTQSAEAYLFYLRGREIEIRAQAPEENETAIKLYQQAIDLDPNFALARARLSMCASQRAHWEESSRWKARARAEADEAVRMRPDLGEAHLAVTHYCLFGESDYDRALRELNRAAELLPNSAEVPLTAAFIYKRQAKFRNRIAALSRAEALDPLNRKVLGYFITTLRWVRDWPEAVHASDRFAALMPEGRSCASRWRRANDEFRLSGDINVLKQMITEPPITEEPSARDSLNAARYETAMLERDYGAAKQFLATIPSDRLGEKSDPVSPHMKVFHEALLAVATKAETKKRALEFARVAVEKRIGHDGADRPHEDLAVLDAFLGRKGDAIREAKGAVDHAVEPAGTIEKNRAFAALAMVYAQTGEPDKAIDLIEHLITAPSELQNGAVYNMTLVDLKWRWQWDPLRSNPRFQRILAAPEPKTVY